MINIELYQSIKKEQFLKTSLHQLDYFDLLLVKCAITIKSLGVIRPEYVTVIKSISPSAELH